jgi:ketosteroid isomerase-like protein
MPFTGPTQDRMLIRELYDRYADAANRGDRTDWLACWTPEARWRCAYFDAVGHPQVAAEYDRIIGGGGVTDTIFFTQLGSIEADGDTAQCRAVTSERLALPGGGSYSVTGRYDDTLARRGGEWLFAFRDYTIKLEATASGETVTGD